jgi:hypothetical protein
MLFGEIIAVYSGNQAPRPGAEHAVRMTEKREGNFHKLRPLKASWITPDVKFSKAVTTY